MVWGYFGLPVDIFDCGHPSFGMFNFHVSAYFIKSWVRVAFDSVCV